MWFCIVAEPYHLPASVDKSSWTLETLSAVHRGTAPDQCFHSQHTCSYFSSGKKTRFRHSSSAKLEADEAALVQTHGGQHSRNLSEALKDPVRKALSLLQCKGGQGGNYCNFIPQCDLGWYYEAETVKESNKSLSCTLKRSQMFVCHVSGQLFSMEAWSPLQREEIRRKGKECTPLSTGGPRKPTTEAPNPSISQHPQDRPNPTSYLTERNWKYERSQPSLPATSV